MRRGGGRLFALILAGAALAGCLRNPAGGGLQFPILYGAETEAEIGDDAHRKVLRQYGGLYRHSGLEETLERVVQRLAPQVHLADDADFTWRGFLLNDPVPNAFAVQGGRLYLTRGMAVLFNDEAEMAGVIGHEMGHVAARHGAAIGGLGVALEIAHAAASLAGLNPAASRDLTQFIYSAYSRNQEREADTLGFGYMTAAGYDPRGAWRFMRSLNRRKTYETLIGDRPLFTFSLYQTHPPTDERVATLDKLAATYPADGDRGDVAGFLRGMEGVSWGDKPASGYVQGRDFLHPGLKIAFTAAEGWRLSTAARRVTAENPAVGGLMIFDTADAGADVGDDAKTYLAGLWAGSAPLDHLRKRRIAGFSAATGRGRIITPYGPAALSAAAVIDEQAKRIFRFACLWPEEGAAATVAATAESCTQMVESLRPITRAGLKARTAERIAVTPVLPGDTVANAAARLGRIPRAETLLRVLNGLDEGEEPRVGGRLKVIVSD
jgi:predicted Zn-dependent protease